MVNSIWDELVVNCLVSTESSYFRKWFTKYFTSGSSKEVITLEFRRNFFYEKIQYLNLGNMNLSKQELLMIFSEIFIRINHLVGNLNEKVVRLVEQTSYTLSSPTIKEEKKIYYSSINPEELIGMEALWDIAITTDDLLLAEELIDFIVTFYTIPEYSDSNTDLPKFSEFAKIYLEKCEKIITENTA